MKWSAQVDSYCERIDPSFWAEPVNAVTNAAFLISAFIMWRRVRGQELPLASLLVVILAVIGLGSFLFHTFATMWASTADVVPILIYILVYIYLANRVYWQLPLWSALGITALFFPYAAATIPVFSKFEFLGSSSAYAPVALLIFIYAVLLKRRLPDVAQGLQIGVMLLVISLFFRATDLPVCRYVPLGSHFLWHILNAIMLGWMIEVYRRHATAKPWANAEKDVS